MLGRVVAVATDSWDGWILFSVRVRKEGLTEKQDLPISRAGRVSGVKTEATLLDSSLQESSIGQLGR
jgi:hypothetical protein